MYTFISYSHKDSNTVFPYIHSLEDSGTDIWYDKHIRVGDDWANTIAISIKNASHILLFWSKNAQKSVDVKRELRIAAENGVPIRIIRLDKTPLPENLPETVEVVSAKDAGVKIRRYSSLIKKVAITVALFILFVAVIFFIVKQYARTVPDVTGMALSDAQKTLEEYRISFDISQEYNRSVPFGYIVSQSKTGRIFFESTVILCESIGPDEDLEIMPDLVGKNIADATKEIYYCGFDGLQIMFTVAEENGIVLDQNIPSGLSVSARIQPCITVAGNGEPLEVGIGWAQYTVSAQNPNILFSR